MKQKYFWLKLIGTAILLHVTLIILSIIEVAIYSYLINPGKDQAFYSAHANITGPWVSGIFGSVFIFLLVRRFIKRNQGLYFTYSIALPLTYIILDILMLLPFGINWQEHLPVFLSANGAKIIASLLAYFIYRRQGITGGRGLQM